MTLILGINLTDRFYLAADTRVTRTSSTSGKEYADNILKISALGDEKKYFSHKKTKRHIMVAVAGNVRLATFLFESLSEAISNNELSGNPSTLKKSIKPFTEELMRQWIYDMEMPTDVNCCLLLCGYNYKNSKKIPVEKMQRVFESHYKPKEYEKHLEQKEQLRNAKVSDADRASGFDPIAMAEGLEYQNAIHPTKIIEELVASDGLLLHEPESVMFSVLVSGNSGVTIESCEWGEVLAYGTGGITKDQIPDSLFGNLEFSKMKKFTEHQPDFWEGVMLDHLIKDQSFLDVKKSEIGPIICTYAIRKDEFYPIQMKAGGDGEPLEFKMDMIPGKGIQIFQDKFGTFLLEPFYKIKSEAQSLDAYY